MHDSTTSFIDTVKKAGYSVTKTRLTVFKVLLNSEALRMNEIVQLSAPAINRASVYRTIDLFEKLGIVQRVQHGWKYTIELTDTYHHHHHHMRCLSCHKLFTIEGDTHLEIDLKKLAAAQHFTMTQHTVEIQGYCKICTQKSV